MAVRVLKGILTAVGNTPLVELENLLPGFGGRVYAKLERFNPGGSIKDRPALNMLLGKIQRGSLQAGRSVIVESSSGNLAVGLAQVCQYFGMRFICVVDNKTTDQNLAILRAYHAEIEVITTRDPQSNEYLPVRLRRVRELVRTTPHAFWPNQYANPLNAQAHEQTMGEIAVALNHKVDYLICSVGSYGTLRGCAQYIRKHAMDTTIIAVDAVGSAIFDGQEPTTRLIPGHGAALRPALFDARMADKVVHVTDLECIAACRRLTLREAILGGGSSGATVAALERIRSMIPDEANCVLIFPDGGDRYLDTIYSEDWVEQNFGEVSHLWKETVGEALAQC